jgi:hypothetical protein
MPQEHEAKDSQLLNKIEKFQQAKFMVWFENNFIKIVFGVLIFYVFPLIFLSAFLNKQFQEQSASPLFFYSIILSSILFLLTLFRILQFFLFILTKIIRVTQQNHQ